MIKNRSRASVWKTSRRGHHQVFISKIRNNAYIINRNGFDILLILKINVIFEMFMPLLACGWTQVVVRRSPSISLLHFFHFLSRWLSFAFITFSFARYRHVSHLYAFISSLISSLRFASHRWRTSRKSLKLMPLFILFFPRPFLSECSETGLLFMKL
jgi:hypothetical protein